MTHTNVALPQSFCHNGNTLTGKNILVTGAASDMGHSICNAIADAGANILMLDQREKLLTGLYDEIVARQGTEPLLVTFDLKKANDDDVVSLASGLSGELDALHGVVQLPLTALPLAPFDLTTAESWTQGWNLLFYKPMQLTRALLPLLDKTHSASVVFSGLNQGRAGKAYWGAAGAAFGAIENLSQVLADEFDGIRFNTLDPGRVNSALRHKYYPAEAKSGLRKHWDQYLLSHYIFLLSDESRDISGKMLKVPDIHG